MRRERASEHGHLPASANTVVLHLNTHCVVTWQTTSERGGGGGKGGGKGGGRHCTESTITTMDRHTPNTHYCTGSQSAFQCTLLAARTSLCLGQEKTTNEPINKQTDKKKNDTHFGSHWPIKKINQKRNLEYKKKPVAPDFTESIFSITGFWTALRFFF